MFNQPRRPYYNYSTPSRESAPPEVSTIENKRFWQLLKQLKRRTQKSDQDQDQPAHSG